MMSIGKRIGDSIYVHRDYAVQVLPKAPFVVARIYLIEEYPKFDWDYVKFNRSTGTFTFTKVDDFDKIDEPSVIEQIQVKKSGHIKKLPRHADPYIIHGKHLMVGPDYKGFDYQRLKDRFKSYQHLDKTRMGKKSWWDKNFLTK